MQVISSPAEMQTRAWTLRAEGRRIGFVPTMGFLHEGHLALMRLARRHADVVVVSIFVNPTQFGPNEDFSEYPRDFERDKALCRKEDVDIVFHPTAAEIYRSDHSVFVREGKLSRGLCGAARPGHFEGVCTIVTKLFNLVLPHAAIFGEKDGQQLRIIERMARDLNFPIQIIRGPTVREPDGLAMSSRNRHLNLEERKQALCLRKALDEAEALYRDEERDAEVIKTRMRGIIAREPLARLDYIEIVDDTTLEPVSRIDRPCMIALAVFLGKTRLIDNIVVGRT